jgi:hypothetical protein
MCLATLHLYPPPRKRYIDQTADNRSRQKQKCTLLGHAETGKRKGCYIEEDKNQQHWNQKQQEKK